MSYLRGPDRSQTQLLPPCLDDYVAPNAPARFLDAYVEGLDFAALGLVERILAAQRAAPSAGTSALEHEIDQRVYRLYALTPAEIKLAEEAAK